MLKEYIEVKIASPKKILSWTERSLINGKFIGEVKNLKTIDKNYQPISGGLFCEEIFGPMNDYECSCKRHKKAKKILKRNNVKICKNCNVEITKSEIRNYRLGYINLKSSVIHPWYFKRNPDYVSTVLNITKTKTNNIIYEKQKMKIDNNKITGGEAINALLKKINLTEYTKLINKKKDEIEKELKLSGKDKEEILKRKVRSYQKTLMILNLFIQNKTKPNWMIIKYLPVLPPNLRPMIKLKDNTLARTEINQKYSKTIETNQKIEKLIKFGTEENFILDEKISLQKSVDQIIRSKESTNSLSTRIEGKPGFIRKNLLGKTVDYSARSVITVEPKLKLNQCGLPKEIGETYK